MDWNVLKLNHHYVGNLYGVVIYYLKFENCDSTYMTLSPKVYERIVKDGYLKLG